MAFHHHLATVVKFKADDNSVDVSSKMANCLYKVKLDQRLKNIMEELWILSQDGKFNNKSINYLLADFKYENNGKGIRCKVLCPVNDMKLIASMEFLKVIKVTSSNDKIYGMVGVSGCSPENGAYFGVEIASLDLGVTYSPMYCFPDGVNNLQISGYLAFCKVALEHRKPENAIKEWAHKDPPRVISIGGLGVLCHDDAVPIP